MMVAALLLESQSAVATCVRSRLVQVDVDFRVAEVLVAASARHDSLLALDDRLFGDQVDGPALVDDLGGIREANVSVVILVVGLKAVVNKMLFNQTTTTTNRFPNLACVCHLGALVGCIENVGSLCGD